MTGHFGDRAATSHARGPVNYMESAPLAHLVMDSVRVRKKDGLELSAMLVGMPTTAKSASSNVPTAAL